MPKSEIQVRSASASDASYLVELERQSPTAAHWRESFYRELFEGRTGERVSLVAEEGGALRGFLVARIADDECELENIVVAESSRRSGVGGKLMGALKDSLRGPKVVRIFLEVRESNVAARALYQKCGFEIEGRRKSYYSNPEEDAVLYSGVL